MPGHEPGQAGSGERSASTSNRNFEGRQGKGGRTHLVSPAVAAATAVAGHFATPEDLRAHEGRRASSPATAVPLRRSDVDTDQIIPAEWLKRVERTGFGAGLFSSWRDDRGFVLNDARYAGATVLVAGENFGTGSSREHAVWALQDYGFDAVISPRFSRHLPQQLHEERPGADRAGRRCRRLAPRRHRGGPDVEVTVDMERLTVEAPAIGLVAPFPMDPAHATSLPRGPGRHRDHARSGRRDRRLRGRRPAWMAARSGGGVVSRGHGRPSSGVGRGAGVDRARGPGRGPSEGGRRLWFLLAGAMALVFLGIMSSDTLCPEHRLWVLLLGGASLIAAGAAIVGLIDGWAGAPLLALASALGGVGDRPDRRRRTPPAAADHRARLRARVRRCLLAWCGVRAGSTVGIASGPLAAAGSRRVPASPAPTPAGGQPV